MSMKTQLPVNYRPPQWATKEFRRLLLVGVMGCAVIAMAMAVVLAELLVWLRSGHW